MPSIASSRRSFIAASVSAAFAAPARPMPNVILCMADDLGWGDTAFNGHPHLKTPNLDAIASAGIRFDRFYSGAPVCSPTRGSVLTGRHPFRYGIFNANVGHIPRQEITLAQELKRHGYLTGHFGKWHLGSLSSDIPDGRRGGKEIEHYAPPWDRGFDHCFSTEQAVPTWNPNERQPFLTRFWTGPGRFDTENLEGDDSRVIMDRAVPFIRRAVQSRVPFLAVIWFHSPHLPVIGGPQYRAIYSGLSLGEQHYFGSITAMDEQVGRLRQELRGLNVADRTMLWFCSDNGPNGASGDSGLDRGSTRGLRGRKHSLFEGGIRVPGLLEWPARLRTPRSTSVPCSTSDYFPTILDALGLPASARTKPFDGVSLLPLIDGKAKSRSSPIAFETTDDGKDGLAKRLGSPALAMVDNRHKLLTDLDPGRAGEDMLFDLSADPAEQANLASSQTAVVKSMKQSLSQWRQSCRADREALALPPAR